jgi:nitroreductase
MEYILNRRSIRKFKPHEMTAEEERQILLAGFSAPSCTHMYPIEFITVHKQESLNKIAEMHPFS